MEKIKINKKMLSSIKIAQKKISKHFVIIDNSYLLEKLKKSVEVYVKHNEDVIVNKNQKYRLEYDTDVQEFGNLNLNLYIKLKDLPEEYFETDDVKLIINVVILYNDLIDIDYVNYTLKNTIINNKSTDVGLSINFVLKNDGENIVGIEKKNNIDNIKFLLNFYCEKGLL